MMKKCGKKKGETGAYVVVLQEPIDPPDSTKVHVAAFRVCTTPPTGTTVQVCTRPKLPIYQSLVVQGYMLFHHYKSFGDAVFNASSVVGVPFSKGAYQSQLSAYHPTCRAAGHSVSRWWRSGSWWWVEKRCWPWHFQWRQT